MISNTYRRIKWHGLKNEVSLPAQIEHMITQLRDTSTPVAQRDNYCMLLEKIVQKLNKEIEDFKWDATKQEIRKSKKKAY